MSRGVLTQNQICLVGYTSDIIVGTVHGGVGVHITSLSLAQLVVTLKVFFASQFLWATSVASFRLAILLLYIEIFRRPGFLRAATATAVIIGLYYVACLLTVCFLCRPINFNWNKTISGQCEHTRAIEIFSAVFNMVLDVWVVCLPLPIVWQLQMPTKKKVGISATFALSLINAGINLGRLIQSIICNEADATYCFEDSALLVMGEMSSGILVACVPTMGPVFFPNRFRPTKTAYKLSRRPFQRDAPAVNSAESAASINRSPYTTLQEGGSELQAIVRAGDTNTRKQVPAEQF